MVHDTHRRHPCALLASTVACAAVLAGAEPTAAQEPITWENSTELSYVATGGNASSSTLGLKAALTGTKEPNVFKFELGGIRTNVDKTTRTATGTATSFTINETTINETTAENYFAKARYDRNFSQAFFFAGAGWDRNTFAGVQNRYALVTGVGRTFVDGESGHFKADIGVTYTIQKDVDPAPNADEGFGGVRLSVDAARKLSESADYTSALIVDENVEQTDDLRADWTNSISVALSEKLALKTSLQLLYDHLPSLLSVPLVDGAGAPTGTTVPTPGDTLDRVVTVALVIKF